MFCASRLWVSITIRLNGPERHHGVVFVNHVVAMQWISPSKVSESEENLYRLIVVEFHHIFA